MSTAPCRGVGVWYHPGSSVYSSIVMLAVVGLIVTVVSRASTP